MDNWLLYILVVVAIACGWWLGRRERGRQASSANRDYYTGLNYLLNEQPDRAVSAFIENLAVTRETLDTHLALGSLLRRQGEVDKAVEVHEHILTHDGFDEEALANVRLELARDYLLAGLLDRAENILLGLVNRRDRLRDESLALLQEIYEREKDWHKAIAIGRQRAVGADPAKVERAISHYYCEIALEQVELGDTEAARAAISEAIGHDALNPRTSMLLGEIELNEGHFSEALGVLQRIKEQAPVYVADSLPLLGAAANGADKVGQLQQYLRECLTVTPSISIVLALAVSVREAAGDEAMAKFIAGHLKQHPTLRGLTQLIDLHMDQTQGVARQNLSILRSFAEALAADKPAYRCGECGFGAKKLHWHCPVCKQWGSVHAIFGLEGE